MKNRFKRVSKNRKLLIILIVGLMYSCSKKDDTTPNSSITPNTQNTIIPWGKSIDLPNINAGGSNYIGGMKTSNEGVYFTVYKDYTSGMGYNSAWVYRLQNGGPSPSWIFYKLDTALFGGAADYELGHESYEIADEFSINVYSYDKFSLVNLNNNLPALMQVGAPIYSNGFSHDTLFGSLVLSDHSTYTNRWAIDGATVYKKQNNNTGLYDNICTIPDLMQWTSNPSLIVKVDPTESIIWLSVEKKIFKINTTGIMTSFDVSSFENPAINDGNIKKICFPYDAAQRDVYFQCENNVFKIDENNVLSLFYTIDNTDLNGGDWCGDFAVDRGYLYATDGTKKSLSLLTKTNIIPPRPITNDQAILMDYDYMLVGFRNGTIEVSKDPFVNYIYNLFGSRLNMIPKSL